MERARGAEGTRFSDRGAWRVGGLIGALIYSLVCWAFIYNGVMAVIAWTKPAPAIEAAAAPRDVQPPGTDPRR